MDWANLKINLENNLLTGAVKSAVFSDPNAGPKGQWSAYAGLKKYRVPMLLPGLNKLNLANNDLRLIEKDAFLGMGLWPSMLMQLNLLGNLDLAWEENCGGGLFHRYLVPNDEEVVFENETENENGEQMEEMESAVDGQNAGQNTPGEWIPPYDRRLPLLRYAMVKIQQLSVDFKMTVNLTQWQRYDNATQNASHFISFDRACERVGLSMGNNGSQQFSQNGGEMQYIPGQLPASQGHQHPAVTALMWDPLQDYMVMEELPLCKFLLYTRCTDDYTYHMWDCIDNCIPLYTFQVELGNGACHDGTMATHLDEDTVATGQAHFDCEKYAFLNFVNFDDSLMMGELLLSNTSAVLSFCPILSHRSCIVPSCEINSYNMHDLKPVISNCH